MLSELLLHLCVALVFHGIRHPLSEELHVASASPAAFVFISNHDSKLLQLSRYRNNWPGSRTL